MASPMQLREAVEIVAAQGWGVSEMLGERYLRARSLVDAAVEAHEALDRMTESDPCGPLTENAALMRWNECVNKLRALERGEEIK